MPGPTTIRGEITAGTDPAGNALNYGPLYLRPEDNGEPLILVQDSMAAQAPIDHLAMQSRPAFEHALGRTVEVEGYRTADVIYGASIVGPEDALPKPMLS